MEVDTLENHDIFGNEDEEDERDSPMNDNEENENQQPEDSTSTDPKAVPIKPKRVIKNPQPKLDATRLMGPRGINILQKSCKEIKFKGKGHEKEDLNSLMKTLELWAHRLFPKLPFDDTLKQIEKLGSKKQVQNMVQLIRLDMFQSDEIKDSNGVKDATEPTSKENDGPPSVDVFDELLGSIAPLSKDDDILITASQMINDTSQAAQALTAEQEDQIEKNRLLALEKRKKFLSLSKNPPTISNPEEEEEAFEFDV